MPHEAKEIADLTGLDPATVLYHARESGIGPAGRIGGRPWFTAKQVADLVAYINSRSYIIRHQRKLTAAVPA